MFSLLFRPGARLASAEERRRFGRETARLPAFLTAGGRSIPCTTANLSPGGVRLTFATDVYPPDDVEVHVPSRGVRARGRVVWRDDRTIGVEFVRPA